MGTTMSNAKAKRVVRGWAHSLKPLRWTVDNLLCYGEDEIARAIRVLGPDTAWEVCQGA